ncbi:MAG: hypothetical protein KF883_09500 [Thermomicrobiales bacterium]|nr:hypothetical protein [Thermomicrobiales bacterium]
MTVSVSRRRMLAFISTLLLILAAGAFATQPAPRTATAQEATPVAAAVREVMVSGFPENANGQALQLLRTVVPAGVVLPQHTHPGMQAAWVESGVLTYTVVEGGSVPVTRKGSEGSPEPAEMLGPGETTDLHPGDAVVEIEGVVHFGANLGTEDVILWSAVLFDPDLPAAIPFVPEATPES